MFVTMKDVMFYTRLPQVFHWQFSVYLVISDCSSSGNHLEVIALVVERGVDVKLADMSGSTALHKLAFLGNHLAVQLLLSKGTQDFFSFIN